MGLIYFDEHGPL